MTPTCGCCCAKLPSIIAPWRPSTKLAAIFFATSLGNKLAGYLSGYFVANDAGVLVRLYGGIAVALLGAALLLYFLTPRLQRMAGRED